MKKTLLAVSLAVIFNNISADEFRITTGHPGCTECNGADVVGERPTSVGTFLDEEGNFVQQNGEDLNLGRLDFVLTQDVVTGDELLSQRINETNNRLDNLNFNDVPSMESTQTALDSLSNRIHSLDKKYAGAVAMSQAAAAMPVVPNTSFNVGVGASTFDSHSAFSLGLMTRSEYAYYQVNVSGDDMGQVTVSGGVSVGF